MDALNGEASPREESMEEQEAAEYMPVENAADLVPEEPPAAVRRSQTMCRMPACVVCAF